jgi:hypothetical protein
MIHRPGFALGKLPKREDPRTLQLARYLNLDAIPLIPSGADWAKWVTRFGMFENNRIGDCTCASHAHGIQSRTANALGQTAVVTVADASVVAMYSAISGYDPSHPSTDRGAYCLDALKYMRSTGLEGHKIDAFAEVNPRHHAMVRAALWLFGGLYIGAILHESVWDSPIWDAPKPGEDVVGGHAMWLCADDADRLTVATWGGKQPVTWDWLDEECDEAYACLARDWLDVGGRCPSGFDLAALQSDLQTVTQ